MSDQNLFLPVCGPLILLFILIVAITGMKSRLRFAKRLFNAYKDENKMENWRKNSNRHRLFLLIALFSILGILSLGLLIFTGLLPMSNMLLIGFVVLVLLCLISGVVMLIELEKLVK